MVAQIVNGKAIAKKLSEELSVKVSDLVISPKLAVIMVGNNEASKIYVRNKQKAAQEVGMLCDIYSFAANVSENEIVEQISELNNDDSVNGIIVQLPLPENINERVILEAVSQDKDVDAFKQVMSGALWQNNASWASATPQGVLFLLKTIVPDLQGKHAVVIGRSNIVGKPMAALLLNENCTVTITHSKTIGLVDIVKTADIVVAACGCPKMIKKDWIKPGAIVLDVGISKIGNKLSGDVDFDDVLGIASAITPVPGGVGPMTVYMLLENTYKAYLKQKNML